MIVTKCRILESVVRRGNSRSHSNVATRRSFKINHHSHSYYSDILKKKIRFDKISTRANRTIMYHGGIDNYTIISSASKLSPALTTIRKMIINTISKPEFIKRRKKLLEINKKHNHEKIEK